MTPPAQQRAGGKRTHPDDKLRLAVSVAALDALGGAENDDVQGALIRVLGERLDAGVVDDALVSGDNSVLVWRALLLPERSTYTFFT